MIGMLFSGLASAGSRVGWLAFSLGLWLISRPGGWAVLVVLILVGFKMFPQGVAAPVAP